MSQPKHFLSITDLNADEIWQILKLAKDFKAEFSTNRKNKKVLGAKQMAMLFEKPSLRTKLSFDVAFSDLGGNVIYFGSQEVGLGVREPVSDVATVVSSMVDVIVARVNSHKNLEELANNATVPVINALSDLEHPCQTLADILTIWESKGILKGLNLAFVGDGNNNVTHSLSLACGLLGINFRCASPKGFEMDPEILKQATACGKITGSKILMTNDPKKAVSGADIVYTDTWVSMGNEAEKIKRVIKLKPYQVTVKLMSYAKNDAIFMHDMPMYRGSEVVEAVADGKQSVIFRQAENRLHAQKALLYWLMK